MLVFHHQYCSVGDTISIKAVEKFFHVLIIIFFHWCLSVLHYATLLVFSSTLPANGQSRKQTALLTDAFFNLSLRQSLYLHILVSGDSLVSGRKHFYENWIFLLFTQKARSPFV